MEPRLTTARLERAKIEEKQGDTAAARADFDQALTEGPWIVDALVGRARLDMESGENKAAINDLTEALKLRPERSDAWLRGCRPSKRRRMRAAARTMARRSGCGRTRPPPTWPGPSLLQVGDNAAALADVDAAIALDPTSADAYNQRGRIEAASGNLDQAVADFTQAITSSRISPAPTATGPACWSAGAIWTRHRPISRRRSSIARPCPRLHLARRMR